MNSFRGLLKSEKTKHSLIVVASILFVMHLAVLIGLAMFYQSYPMIVGLALLAYGFGLRHSVDPDHLAAIDNVTRKLMQDGNQPVTVGFFFALGHSTIVVLVSAFVAMSAGCITARMPMFKSVGALIGTSASCLFLLLIGTINFLVLLDTIKVWRKIKSGGAEAYDNSARLTLPDGLLTRALKPLITMVRSSWHIYWIGLIFGLGFDTASEVALLSMTGSTSANAIPLMAVMVLPLAFTAGMSLVDTIDGVLMLGAYGWAFIEPVRKVYYNICITSISVALAILIGGLEALQLIAQSTGRGASITHLADNMQFSSWGYYIILVFALCWAGSVTLSKFRGGIAVED